MARFLRERGFAFYRNLEKAEENCGPADSATILKRCSVEAALSEVALLQTLLQTLQAPEDYEKYANYDSFDEIIRDLEWLEFDTLILIMTGCSAQWARNYQPMSMVLEICADAVIFWRQLGKELFIAMVD